MSGCEHKKWFKFKCVYGIMATRNYKSGYTLGEAAHGAMQNISTSTQLSRGFLHQVGRQSSSPHVCWQELTNRASKG